jgi:hypothetical protein
VRILRVFERNTRDMRIFFTINGELTFQMQAMTQMMERMNSVIGNMCDKLDKVEKRGNEAGTST